MTSVAQIRRELEALVVGDLHGPAGGATEILPEGPPPRDRYLLGALAPRKDKVLPNEFDFAPSGTETGAPTEDRIAPPTHLPSSIGLTFAVPADTPALAVTARWGSYRKGKRLGRDLVGLVGFADDIDPDGEHAVWAREQHEGTLTVALDAETIAPERPDPAVENVFVRGRVRRLGSASLVTLFLVNDQAMPEKNLDERWLFQVQLEVSDLDDGALFLERTAALPPEIAFPDSADEQAALRMLYRDRLDYAVGCGTAVEAEGARSGGNAARLRTVNVPRFEVPLVEAPSTAEDPGLAGLELDMKVLARAQGEPLVRSLMPLVSGYRSWIERQRSRIDAPGSGLAPFRETASHHLEIASRMADRIEAGISLLARNADAADAFRFANEAMWRQRTRTLAIAQRRVSADSVKFDIEAAAKAKDTPRDHSWRVFQLAFILLNLPALTDLSHPERGSQAGLVDLLFFPTGGGKTEAYLGLAAYTFAIRRLRGTLESEDGPLDGSGGIGVLMRYTLRLLTAQQFQRAAALVSACEVVRRERAADDARWRTAPIRLGLYIGGASTPNSVNEAFRAIEAAKVRAGRTGGFADPLKLEFCPWCGTELKLAHDVGLDKDRARVILECPDRTGRCPFTPRNSAGEGIPVLTTDEEIYRLLPDFVIATVDKFAQLPWNGALHTLFGRVSQRCQRHGYRWRDLVHVGTKDESDRHIAVNGLPAAVTVPCDRLRPPDLIIQDELHLISGPLGTLVGLYEAAIDKLAGVSIGGNVVRPKVIASTATIRRAERQVSEIFARDLAVFPPSGLDAGDNFFAVERPVGSHPGRCYVGICARGQRMKAIEARIAIAVLAAAQKLFDQYGEAVDPYMTMLAYFNSVRELAGMRRLLDDDVRTRLPKAEQRGLGKRTSFLNVRELTSRIGANEILEVLDLLGLRFEKKPKAERKLRPLDVVLATNMISVGVDIARLGLMVVAGQPKSTAEYIQATSRVGRDVAGPGLVFTIYNWSRPRDLSHYERFAFDHATFYRQVEALSVTPFARRALDRGLTAVLVALVRHEHAHRALGDRTNPNAAAQRVPIEDAAIGGVADYLRDRAMRSAGDAATARAVGELARNRLDAWFARERRTEKESASLSYAKAAPTLLDDGLSVRWNEWSAPNSLRDVEREINLQLDRNDASMEHAPSFSLATPPSTAP
jgi:hypothetical protein